MPAPEGSSWPQPPEHGVRAGLAAPASCGTQGRGLLWSEAGGWESRLPGGLGWATSVGTTGGTMPPLAPLVPGGHRGSRESPPASGRRPSALVRWKRA